MLKIKKKLLGLVMVGAITVSQFTAVNPVFGVESQSTRVYGVNRYETANAIATKFWSTTDYAVLARGDQYPDALCAGPLAYAYGAPILLTEPNTLAASTSNVLSTLKVKTIFIVGGTGAVSSKIETSLKSKYTVIRIAGNDRYATSAAIAQKVKEKLGTISNIVLATGENYPDALSVSSIAAKKGMPILLTNTNTLPISISNFIKANSVIRTYVIGGTGAITSTVDGKVPNPKRLSGIDRFTTNVAVMNEFASSINFNKLFVSVGNGISGSGFADALSGSAAAAMSSSPVVLIYQTLSAGTNSYLLTKVSGSTTLVLLGGTAVVPTVVETAVLNDINIPALTGLSLTDKASGNKVTAVIEEPVSNTSTGRITFNIPSAYSKFDGGTAVLSEDLKSVSISSVKLSAKTAANIKKTDNFVSIIFNQMTAAGFDPVNGILSANIKYFLNGATLNLTDLDGNVKTYTILVNYTEAG